MGKILVIERPFVLISDEYGHFWSFLVLPAFIYNTCVHLCISQSEHREVSKVLAVGMIRIRIMSDCPVFSVSVSLTHTCMCVHTHMMGLHPGSADTLHHPCLSLVLFWDKVLLTYQSWLHTWKPPASASWATGITQLHLQLFYEFGTVDYFHGQCSVFNILFRSH